MKKHYKLFFIALAIGIILVYFVHSYYQTKMDAYDILKKDLFWYKIKMTGEKGGVPE